MDIPATNTQCIGALRSIWHDRAGPLGWAPLPPVLIISVIAMDFFLECGLARVEKSR